MEENDISIQYYITYSIDFTESALKIWRQISKSGDVALLICWFRKTNTTIFSRIFCLIFLFDAIKPNQFCFFFVWFAGGNKNIIQNKQKKVLLYPLP